MKGVNLTAEVLSFNADEIVVNVKSTKEKPQDILRALTKKLVNDANEEDLHFFIKEMFSSHKQTFKANVSYPDDCAKFHVFHLAKEEDTLSPSMELKSEKSHSRQANDGPVGDICSAGGTAVGLSKVLKLFCWYIIIFSQDKQIEEAADKVRKLKAQAAPQVGFKFSR